MRSFFRTLGRELFLTKTYFFIYSTKNLGIKVLIDQKPTKTWLFADQNNQILFLLQKVEIQDQNGPKKVYNRLKLNKSKLLYQILN
jgi:hypothetical protein